MAKYISAERLRAILQNHVLTPKTQSFIQYLIDKECRELQESWMTLEEFLKSGFEGWCWINLNPITGAYKLNDNFYLTDDVVDLRVHKIDKITHVQPIHKPEPPR